MRASTLALTLLVGSVAREEARGSELAKLHSDHVFVDRHRHELAAVVDIEGQANELWQDGRATRPGLDRRTAALVLSGFRLLQERQFDERTFPDGASHFRLALLLRVTRLDDELVGRIVVTRAGALGRRAPRGSRVTAARGPAFTTAVRGIDRVLGNTAGQRALAHPTAAASLGVILVGVVGVRHRTNRR